MVEEKWTGEEENKSATVTRKDDLVNFDEMTVKGANNHQKLIIPIMKLQSPDLKELKDCLEDVQLISQKLVNLIDSLEEMSLPFSVYNSFKKLADMDTEAKDGIILIDLV